MRFHLDYTPEKFDFEIDHSDNILLLGSCFTENIGRMLGDHKFRTLSNPCGILFNPLSVLSCLGNIIHQREIKEEHLIERDGIYYSYFHHSSIHASSKTGLQDKINTANQSSLEFLKSASVLIISFGTAFAYRQLQLDLMVANCHKQPGNYFSKHLLKVHEISNDWRSLIAGLQKINPSLKIIFTVSPVKYLKDGVVQNNISKATLVLSVHQIISENQNCYYFPAYELVNDDLRDHRFYKEDLAHPNETAIRYVWNKFAAALFPEKTRNINGLLEKINRVMAHQPFNEQESAGHKLREFIAQQKEQVLKLDPSIRF